MDIRVADAEKAPRHGPGHHVPQNVRGRRALRSPLIGVRRIHGDRPPVRGRARTR
ncbi:hypothetical protein Ae505Ps2_1965 [Pseudonocardia sp. Ae505_Ps2]|nr:hypothetical protein Ae505Ps2_1965 [Pseudonocardia sp. Ae505_Ps2]